MGVLIDDDKSVDARLADCVVNRGKLVVHRARVDAGEVLQTKSVNDAGGDANARTSERFKSASPTLRLRSS